MKRRDNLIKNYACNWYGNRPFSVYLLEKTEEIPHGVNYDYKGIYTENGHTYHVYIVFNQEAAI